MSEKYREFYTYPASLERADMILGLGERTNITIEYYPHKNTIEGSGLIKFIEIQALKDRDALIQELKGKLEDIKEYRTCEKLNPGCEKYKSYVDGWFGVAVFAEKALNSEAIKKWEGRDG